MDKSLIRVLIVDDYEPWRRYLSSTLRKKEELQVTCEVTDGLEAIQQAQELQPDLILLDIGLPTLNGIEAARQIRAVSPASKILFVSHNPSAEIAEEAVRTGAGGYVIKSYAARELLPAIDAILSGGQFVSASLRGQGVSLPSDGAAIAHSHEVAFYADDSSVVDGYARFIASPLKSGNAVIVILNESHRVSLLPKLDAYGVDIPAAIEKGCYISLDVADTHWRLTVNDMPDPVRCEKVVGDLIREAAKGVKATNGRIVVCGEIAPTMLSQGNAEGAIRLERLWDEITRSYRVQTLCGYLSNAFPHHEADPVFQRVCAEHSAVRGWELGR